MDIEKPITQAAFADLVGTSQPTVSRLVADGTLPRRGKLRDWIRAYVGALETEKEALAGGDDDSAAARAARLALVTATTKLREQQTRMLVREHEASVKQYTDRLLGEVQILLYRKIPDAVVGRLLAIIP